MNREQFCRAKRARSCRSQLSAPVHALSECAAGDQTRHSSAVRGLQALAFLGCIGLITTGAQAHPHVWATIKTELVFAPDASVTTVQHTWTFDDMFSASDAGDRGPHQGPIHASGVAIAGAGQYQFAFKEYAYFTYAKIDGRRQKDAFGNPTDYWLDYDPKATVLTLHFTLPFRKPVRAKRLTVEIYDPEFFIDFGFADKEAVKLVGAPPQCKFTDEKPHDGFFSSALKLDKSFMTSEANIGMGMNFANEISVMCP